MNTPSLRSTERLSIHEGAWYSVMVGAGETYLVAFALALGVSAGGAALLAVLPIVAGSFIQLASVRLVGNMSSPRSWVVSCSVVQAAAVIAFSAALLIPEDPTTVLTYLTIIASIYWGAGQAAGPVWNGWIAQIIASERIRAFFFRRNTVCQAFTLISLLATGLILDMKYVEDVRYLFLVIFIVSGSFRLVSAAFMARHPSDHSFIERGADIDFREWSKRPYFLYTMFFMLLTQTTVHVSAPFFSPYMLKVLELGFRDYAGLLAAMFVARMFCGPILQRFANRFGTHALFVAGVVGIVPVPFLWVFSDNYLYLIFLQILGGLVWSCHELGLTLYLIESMPHRERSRLLGWATTANSIGMLFGVLIGMAIVGTTNLSVGAYFTVFTISSILRLIPLLFVGRFIHSIDPQYVQFRILGVRPVGPSVLKPILLFPVSRAAKNRFKKAPRDGKLPDL